MNSALEQNLALPMTELRAFCERNHIRRLALFGSVLREDFRAGGDDPSDVDVLVEFDPDAKVSYFSLGRMQYELSLLFGRPVDLGTFKMLLPTMRDEVLANMWVVYDA